MIGVDSIEPALKEALFPENDRGSSCLQPLFDGVERRAFGQHQDGAWRQRSIPAGREGDCAMLLSSARWLLVRVTSLPIAIPA